MFKAIFRAAAAAALLAAAFAAPAASAQEPQPRLAWVVGESAYAGDALPTVAGDSALVAKTLAAQGFDVSEAHDLDTPGLASAYQAFLAKVRAAPPGGAVTVYLAGLGVTVGCDDFLLPVDAQVRAAAEVPPNSLSMTQVMNDLAQTHAQVRLVSLDASRPIPSSVSSVAFPKGLIPLAPPSATAFALGAEVHDFEAPPKEGDVGDAYAPALAAALQQPFTDIGTTLHAARLAAHQASGGAQTPWLAVGADMPPFAFVANATPYEAQQAVAALPAAPGPLASMSVDTAYWAAIWRNSVADYQAFIAAFAYTAPADEVQRVNYLISLLTIPNPVCQGSAAPALVPVEPAPVIEIPEPVYNGPVCPDGFEPRFERGVDYCAPIDIGTQCPFGSTPVVVDDVTYCHIISVCPPGSHPVWNGHGWFCHQPCRWSEAGCPCPPDDPRCHRPWPCRPGDPDCRPPEPCHPGEPGCRLPPICHPGEPGCRLPPDCHPGEPGCRPPLMCPPGAHRNSAGECAPGATPSPAPTPSPTGSCPAGERRNPKGACAPGAATPTPTPSATPTPTQSATPTPKPTHTFVHPTVAPTPIPTPTHTFTHPPFTPTHIVAPLHTAAPLRTFSPRPTPLVPHPTMTTAPHPAPPPPPPPPPPPAPAPHPAERHPPCGHLGEPKC